MKQLLICYLGLLLILCSCEWEPAGVFERNVNQNVDIPNIEVVKLDLNDDTLFLYSSITNIYFEFKTVQGQNIYRVEFYLNGSLFYYENSSKGSFLLHQSNFYNEVGNLTIMLYTSTETGSIADVLGAEVFVLSSEKNWLILSRGDYWHNISLAKEDAYLKISWPICYKSDFHEYSITLSGSRKYKTKEPFFIDTSYAGNYQSYLIDIITKSGHSYRWASGKKDFELPSMQICFQEGYRVVWGKSQYYNAIEKWELWESPTQSNSDQRIVKETYDPNDTTFTITNYIFEQSMFYTLKFIPKELSILDDWSNRMFYLQCYIPRMGLESPKYKTEFPYYAFFPTSNDEFLYQPKEYANTIQRYSVSKRAVVDEKIHQPSSCTNISSSYLGSVNVSPNGLYYTAKINCNSIIFGPAANLGDYVMEDFPNYSSGYWNMAPISDVGIGILTNFTTKDLVLYDFNNANELSTINNDTYGNPSNSHISSNGKFFTFLKRSGVSSIPDSLVLSSNQNGQIETVARVLWADVKYTKFSSVEPDNLALLLNHTFFVKRCTDFESILEFIFEDDQLFDIDFYTRQVLSRKGNTLIVRNMDTWEVIFSTEAYNPSNLRLLHNTIFSPFGVCRPFSDYSMAE